MPNLKPQQQRWNIAGSAITAFAMFGQSIFASLLLFKYFEHKGLNRIANFLLMPFTAFTAFKGKYEIVRYFNHDAFINIPNKSWREILFPELFPELKTGSRFVDLFFMFTMLAFTINISALFALLSNLAYRDASPLISDGMSEVAHDDWFNVALFFLGASQSFAANLLSFPYIHMGGLVVLKDILTYPFRSSSIRHQYAEENQKIAAVFGNLKARIEKIIELKRAAPFDDSQLTVDEKNELHDQTQQLQAQLVSLDLIADDGEDKSLEQINTGLTQKNIEATAFRQKALSVYNENPQHYQPFLPYAETWSEWIVTKTLSATAIVAATAGLYNFHQMWSVIFDDYGWSSHQASQAAAIAGWPALISMALMSIASAPITVKAFTDWLYDRSEDIEFQTTSERYTTSAKILTICGIGAAANGYQAFKAGTKIADSELLAMILAFLGPVLVEYGGYKAQQRKAASEKATIVEKPAEPSTTEARAYTADDIDGAEAQPLVPRESPTTLEKNSQIIIGKKVSDFFKAATNACGEIPFRCSRKESDILLNADAVLGTSNTASRA